MNPFEAVLVEARKNRAEKPTLEKEPAGSRTQRRLMAEWQQIQKPLPPAQDTVSTIESL